MVRSLIRKPLGKFTPTVGAASGGRESAKAEIAIAANLLGLPLFTKSQRERPQFLLPLAPDTVDAAWQNTFVRAFKDLSSTTGLALNSDISIQGDSHKQSRTVVQHNHRALETPQSITDFAPIDFDLNNPSLTDSLSENQSHAAESEQPTAQSSSSVVQRHPLGQVEPLGTQQRKAEDWAQKQSQLKSQLKSQRKDIDQEDIDLIADNTETRLEVSKVDEPSNINPTNTKAANTKTESSNTVLPETISKKVVPDQAVKRFTDPDLGTPNITAPEIESQLSPVSSQQEQLRAPSEVPKIDRKHRPDAEEIGSKNIEQEHLPKPDQAPFLTSTPKISIADSPKFSELETRLETDTPKADNLKTKPSATDDLPQLTKNPDPNTTQTTLQNGRNPAISREQSDVTERLETQGVKQSIAPLTPLPLAPSISEQSSSDPAQTVRSEISTAHTPPLIPQTTNDITIPTLQARLKDQTLNRQKFLNLRPPLATLKTKRLPPLKNTGISEAEQSSSLPNPLPNVLSEETLSPNNPPLPDTISTQTNRSINTSRTASESRIISGKDDSATAIQRSATNRNPASEEAIEAPSDFIQSAAENEAFESPISSILAMLSAQPELRAKEISSPTAAETISSDDSIEPVMESTDSAETISLGESTSPESSKDSDDNEAAIAQLATVIYAELRSQLLLRQSAQSGRSPPLSPFTHYNSLFLLALKKPTATALAFPLSPKLLQLTTTMGQALESRLRQDAERHPLQLYRSFLS